MRLTIIVYNISPQAVDLSPFALRYWYQDEAFGTPLIQLTNYVSIGFSGQGTVAAVAAAASPAVAGADHYIEMTFAGALAAANDAQQNDRFNVDITMHTTGFIGTAVLTNDYSYQATAGFDSKITITGAGNAVVWGTPPS